MWPKQRLDGCASPHEHLLERRIAIKRLRRDFEQRVAELVWSIGLEELVAAADRQSFSACSSRDDRPSEGQSRRGADDVDNDAYSAGSAVAAARRR